MPRASSPRKTAPKKKGGLKPATSQSPATAIEPKPMTIQRSAEAERVIRVRGAKEHNLKDVDLTLPRDRLIVMTGLSGSGKSSLAFDTIFAEGQRKYMESLSAYARQFLDQLKKPDVEEIEGIPPTIAIEQRSAAHNPRSTVATTTEIYDYLRLLFARCGVPRSWAPTKVKKDGTVTARSGRRIEASSASQIVDHICGFDEGTRLMVLAPVVRGKKGHHKEALEAFFRTGGDGSASTATSWTCATRSRRAARTRSGLHRYKKHTIEVVVDRIVVRDDARQRLAESIEAALRLGEGSLVVSVNDADDREKWTDHTFSEKFADPDHPEIALDELSPRLFSFNSPFGACPTCHGLGAILEFDRGPRGPRPRSAAAQGRDRAVEEERARRHGLSQVPPPVLPGVRGARLDADGRARRAHLRDADARHDGREEEEFRVSWDGVLPMLHAWFEKTESTWVKDHLHQFQREQACPECHGDRLRVEALHVLLRVIAQGGDGPGVQRDGDRAAPARRVDPEHQRAEPLNINDAIAFVDGLKLTKEQEQIAEPILREVGNRLRFLTSVGLEYLSLDRRTATLSGGEAQRIRLATQVGSGLVGACYVLDEPTIGLHQRDNDRLIKTLRHLTDIGNTVLVVEHDEDMIRHADHVVDIGPGPGVHGGRSSPRARSRRSARRTSASRATTSRGGGRSRSRRRAGR
jgi:excinuclease ABC subunit A